MKILSIAFVVMVLFTFFGYMIGYIFYIVGVFIKYGNFSINKEFYFYEPIVYSWTAIGFFAGIRLFIREIIFYKGKNNDF